MTEREAPITDDHREFARRVVALAREFGANRLMVSFDLSGHIRWKDEPPMLRDYLTVHFNWSEGRHAAESRIGMRAEASVSLEECRPAPCDQASQEPRNPNK